MTAQIRSIMRKGLTATVLVGLLWGLLTVDQAPSQAEAQLQSCGQSGIQFIGFSDALNKTSFDGQPVTELSGLVYDAHRGLYYAVADRAGTVPAHYFAFSVSITAEFLGAPQMSSVTLLRKADGSPFTGLDFDGEAIALTQGGELLIASEGGSAPPLPGPSIRRFTFEGALLGELPTPPRYLVSPSGEGTSNLTWESLALSPSGRSLFTANEGALTGDGQTSDLRSRVRIQRYEAGGPAGFARAEQFFYLTEAGRTATDLGVVEIIAISDADLLVMERGFRAGQGNTLRIFRLSVAGAADVTNEGSLSQPGLTPLAKVLVLDLASCPASGARLAPGATQPNPLLDNFEAMALGPDLPGDRKALLLLSDDNGGANQTTRLVALSVPASALGLPARLSPPATGDGGLLNDDASSTSDYTLGTVATVILLVAVMLAIALAVAGGARKRS